jgi:hypothetical protein
MGFISIVCLAGIYLCSYLQAKIYVFEFVLIYLAVVTIHAFFGFTEVVGTDWGLISSGRYINGNFGQSNFFAATLISAGLIAWYLTFIANKFRQRIIFLALAIYFSSILILTYSIGGIVVFFFILGIMSFDLILLKSGLVKSRLQKIFLTLSNIFLVVLFMLSSFGYFYLQGGSRFLYWSDIPRLILERPAIGFGGYDALYHQITSRNLIDGRIVDRSHNWLLDFLFAYGVVGFLTFSFFLRDLISRIVFQLDKKNIIYLIPVVVFITTGFFHTKSIYHFVELSICLGLFFSTTERN